MLHWSPRRLARKPTLEQVGWFATGLSAAGVAFVVYQVLLGSALASAASSPPRQPLAQTTQPQLARPQTAQLVTAGQRSSWTETAPALPTPLHPTQGQSSMPD